MPSLQVACVQLETQADLDANARAMVSALEKESKRGTRLVLFPECALTTYKKDIIRKLSQPQVDLALSIVREGCRHWKIHAVVGSAYLEAGKRYNGAFVIDPRGEIIKRYAKMHNVDGNLFEDGDAMAIFRIDDVPATIMICHDERYPEIFRIPVLAGAKLGIYISSESKEPRQKMDNYRSQIMARAVENQICVVHCNAGAGGFDGGSHGESRIIDKNGKIVAEAGNRAGEVIRAVIHPRESSNDYASAGAHTPSLHRFWGEGLRVLKEQNPEYFAVPATQATGNP